MVTSEQAEDLLLPLLVRANAVRAWPQVGFVDQAAEYLVRKLELEQPEWREGYRITARHQLELTRCKWIDEQVRKFLDVYPEAMGIELGAGLSTRFQRLSAASDWPRFSWADVDAADVIDCADLIFPRTDNYRLVACDIVRDDWLKKTGWKAQQPLIVIIETLPQAACLRELKTILAPIVNVIANNETPVHLIFDYASPALQRIRKQLRCMLYGKSCCGFADARDLMEQLHLHGQVLNEQDLAADSQGPFMHRLMAKLYGRFTRRYFWGAVHLRLDATLPIHQRPEQV